MIVQFEEDLEIEILKTKNSYLTKVFKPIGRYNPLLF